MFFLSNLFSFNHATSYFRTFAFTYLVLSMQIDVFSCIILIIFCTCLFPLKTFTYLSDLREINIFLFSFFFFFFFFFNVHSSTKRTIGLRRKFAVPQALEGVSFWQQQIFGPQVVSEQPPKTKALLGVTSSSFSAPAHAQGPVVSRSTGSMDLTSLQRSSHEILLVQSRVSADTQPSRFWDPRHAACARVLANTPRRLPCSCHTGSTLPFGPITPGGPNWSKS